MNKKDRKVLTKVFVVTFVVSILGFLIDIYNGLEWNISDYDQGEPLYLEDMTTLGKILTTIVGSTLIALVITLFGKIVLIIKNRKKK